jgi:hypothetical protein
MVIVSAHKLGISFPDQINQSVLMVIYILWIAVKLKDVKEHMVYQSFGSAPAPLFRSFSEYNKERVWYRLTLHTTYEWYKNSSSNSS